MALRAAKGDEDAVNQSDRINSVDGAFNGADSNLMKRQ